VSKKNKPTAPETDTEKIRRLTVENQRMRKSLGILMIDTLCHLAPAFSGTSKSLRDSGEDIWTAVKERRPFLQIGLAARRIPLAPFLKMASLTGFWWMPEPADLPEEHRGQNPLGVVLVPLQMWIEQHGAPGPVDKATRPTDAGKPNLQLVN
jgi:hypothetical protein